MEYTLWSLDSDMEAVVEGMSNAELFHSIYSGNPRFFTLVSKHSAPPFPACLPASYNRDLVDDVGPMIGLLQRVREGESPVQEFTSMCNDVFSKSLAILGLLDSLYVPVTRTETEQLFAHPQGLIRAIRTSHGVVAWAYNKPFRGTSGVVSQEALYKARIDPMHRNTIEDYCRRCASLRAMNMSAAVKVIAAPQPHSTALVCIALGFIYSICTQFYADVVNKRIVWASMYVKRDGRRFLSERINLHLGDFVKQGVHALMKRNVVYKRERALQAIVATNVIEMMATDGLGKSSGTFQYDRQLIADMGKALDIDSYYATCLYKGQRSIDRASLGPDERVRALSCFCSAVSSSYLMAASTLRLELVAAPGTDLVYQDCREDLWRRRIRDAVETVWIYIVAHTGDCVWEDIYENLRTRNGFTDQIIECVMSCHYIVVRNAKILSRIVDANIEYSEAEYGEAMDSVKGWDLELWTEGKACDHVAPIPMLVDHFEGNE